MLLLLLHYMIGALRSNQPTTEQEAKLAQVEKTCHDKVEAILTPEQLQQFRQNQTNITLKPAIASGTMLPFELVGIDLSPQQQLQILEIEKEANSKVEAILPSRQVTPEQRAKMRQLMQSYRQQVEAVLTPEQQQKFRQNLQQWQPNQSN
jgi:protein CpxP